jgi:hypothetical protein
MWIRIRIRNTAYLPAKPCNTRITRLCKASQVKARCLELKMVFIVDLGGGGGGWGVPWKKGVGEVLRLGP